MTTVTITEAKTRLADLLRRMDEGERIVITRHGEAIGELTKTEPAAEVDVFARDARWDRSAIVGFDTDATG